MRSGGYTLHQSLTIEAASIVKQAVSLARRRGHAQVTPLHVATAMLSSPTSFLKRACLQSHTHPLQCKALHLCFNVALNRLPTSASTPLLAPLSSHLPSLSNALVAAFKRAQAHQRRGSVENQQQPILALKVEVEQLVISILDDPSVSRVMREAGFSSTQVKINVEQAVSSDKCNPQKQSTLSQTTAPTSTRQSCLSGLRLSLGEKRRNNDNADVASVLDAMMSKKTKNTVIVCESASSAEGLVRRLIEKFDKKDVPAEMKHVQFISVPLLTLRNISRQEFEVKVAELRSLVKSYVNRGVVLYLGDLDWVSEFWSNYGSDQQREVYYYSPVEYMIMELSRLICENTIRLWIMGIATSQTYAKCRKGRPSLETLWSLHPLTLPAISNLGLSLSLDSGMHEEVIKKEPVDELLQRNGSKNELVCCSDCSSNFKKEAEAAIRDEQEFVTGTSCSSLPSWLQQYKDENKKHITNDCGDKIKDLCKKWNSICSLIHSKRPHFLDSPSPSSSASLSSNGHHNKSKLFHQKPVDWPVIFDPRRTPNEHKYENSGEVSKPELLSNPNSSPNSVSSSEASGDMMMEDDKLKILCNALEKTLPRQRCIIPEIVSTILQCRSGLMKSNIINNPTRNMREESWLCFLGHDHEGKEILARELAKNLFDHDFMAIGITGGSVYDRFLEAVRVNPSRVFYVEDADKLDYRSLKGFERVMRDGSVVLGGDGEVVLMKDAVVVFVCEEFGCGSRACSAQHGVRSEEEDEDEDELKEKKQRGGGMLDLNIATEDGDVDDDSVSGIGILDLVDMQVEFKIQVL